MKRVAIIQSSLRKESNTHIVCKKLEETLQKKEVQVEYIDLRNLELEFCDGRKIEEYNSSIVKSYKVLEEVDSVVFGMPVYNYSFSGVLKNFIDITAYAIGTKKIGVITIAGGPNCYMASRDLFNSMYYETGSQPIYPTVYAWSGNFKDGKIVNDMVLTKINELTEKLVK